MKKALSLLLALVLAAALCGCTVSISRAGRYPDAEKYTVGDFTFQAADVDEIVLSWVSGEARLVRSEAATLSVTEEAPAGLPADALMHWYLDGRTLRIQYCASGYSGTINGLKRLTVEVPDGIALNAGVTSGDLILDSHALSAVNLGCTSGSVSVASLTADSLNMGATSGSLAAAELAISGDLAASATSGTVSIDSLSAASATLSATSGTVSAGEVALTGGLSTAATSGALRFGSVRAGTVSAGSTSGDIALGLASCDSADIAATSGTIAVRLLEGLGARVEFTTASGSLNGADGRVAQLTFGDGSCPVTIATTSGDATVSGE